MSGKPTSREALAAEIFGLKLVRAGRLQTNAAIARHTLAGDLGEHSDSWLTDYSLDEATRDRLLAHARQDASHAVIATERLASRVRLLTWVGFAILVVLAYIAVKL